MKIPRKYGKPLLNVVMDTVQQGKQCIVFVNTRRSAEAQAEKISEQMTQRLPETSENVRNVLSQPTKQCKRLARCVEKGAAFHHSGLHHEQRSIIEEQFKNREIKCICATPTLAMGVDMPAFRVVIRDLKRFGGDGMDWIPVLEYEQMSGRAGRPGFDDHGESIYIATSEEERETVEDKYVTAEPEEIVSKLAVEPVLRTYVLGLVASNFCRDEEELYDFFEETFYAEQYGDATQLRAIIDNMIDQLQDWEFLTGGGAPVDTFVTADQYDEEKPLEATPLGERVSELYLDPLTANHIVECLRKATDGAHVFSWLHMVSNTLEMQPLRVKKSEYEDIQEESLEYIEYIFEEEPSEFSYEYERFLNAVKTSLFFMDYIDEMSEDELMDKYGIRPGGIYAKKETADWLLYAAQEIAQLLEFKPLINEIGKLRERINYGVKDELLPLLKLDKIGRVRARKLYRHDVADMTDVKKADTDRLAGILGKKTAINVKEQVGIDVDESGVEERKQGQFSLGDF